MAKPSTEIYTEQAQLNEKAATNAAQSGDNDWAVTICFYSAIHYVKASKPGVMMINYSLMV
ncbi:MAG: hypothetical protein V7L00_16830 [Nostoc sp.]|uniref:hypothetical protein n=1 Tax=Nostoc sp. TaxID=1180 RepID=UPI002FF5A150